MMNCFSIPALLAALVVCDPPVADEPTNDQDVQVEHSEALYVHYFFRSRKYDGPPPKGGGPTPDFPPSPVVSFRVDLGDPFEVIFSRHHQYSGRVKRDGGSYRAVLDTVLIDEFKFEGEVELDEILVPRATDPAQKNHSLRFVFSRSKDVKPFLKTQAKIDAGNAGDTRVEADHSQPSDPPADEAASSRPSPGGDRTETLYLHYFRPAIDGRGLYTDASETNAHEYTMYPNPVVTIKVRTGRLAEIVPSFSARVSKAKADYSLELKGLYRYSGEVKLEKVFDLESTFFDRDFDGARVILPCRAVLSREKDITPFLKAAAKKAPVKPRRKDEVEPDDR